VMWEADGEPLECCSWPRMPWYSALCCMAHCRGAEAR
jgi:hypothetical protein